MGNFIQAFAGVCPRQGVKSGAERLPETKLGLSRQAAAQGIWYAIAALAVRTDIDLRQTLRLVTGAFAAVLLGAARVITPKPTAAAPPPAGDRIFGLKLGGDTGRKARG